MISIIDSGIGNLGSVQNMLKFLGIQNQIVKTPEEILSADKLIFPGVGSWDHGIKKLQDNNILPSLNQQVLINKVPFLGICLGMQLLFESSEEGTLPGLSLLEGHVRKFNFSEFEHTNRKLNIPHMGWNKVHLEKESLLTKDLDNLSRFYFVHSYHVNCSDESDVLMKSDYGFRFVCGVHRENIWGVQFHPEKSHKFGMILMKNFSEL